jgi:hypothetical protein
MKKKYFFSEAVEADIRKLREDGNTPQEIADKTNLPKLGIDNFLKRHKVFLSEEAKKAIEEKRQRKILETYDLDETKNKLKGRWSRLDESQKLELRQKYSSAQKRRVWSEEELKQSADLRRKRNYEEIARKLKEEGFSSSWEKYNSIALSNGGNLVSQYSSSQKKHRWVCSKGHVFSMTPNCVQTGQWCPKCSLRGPSMGQLEIYELIKSLGIECELSNRKVIRPYELDIWIPKGKLAIEFNGLYWHAKSESNRKHKTKGSMCRELGIRLLVIWEDEWKNDRDRIKDIIINCLNGQCPPKTYSFWTNGDERVDPKAYSGTRAIAKIESYEEVD